MAFLEYIPLAYAIIALIGEALLLWDGKKYSLIGLENSSTSPNLKSWDNERRLFKILGILYAIICASFLYDLSQGKYKEAFIFFAVSLLIGLAYYFYKKKEGHLGTEKPEDIVHRIHLTHWYFWGIALIGCVADLFLKIFH